MTAPLHPSCAGMTSTLTDAFVTTAKPRIAMAENVIVNLIRILSTRFNRAEIRVREEIPSNIEKIVLWPGTLAYRAAVSLALN